MRGSRHPFAAIFTCLAILFSCTKSDPDPALLITSVKVGSADMLGAGVTTNVDVNPTFNITFSTTLDPASITTTTVTLTSGSASVVPSFVVAGTSLSVACALAYETEYTLTIKGDVRSDKGVKLGSPTTVVFKTKSAPPPPFSVTSIKCGTVELTSGSLVTAVPVNLPIVVSFSGTVDASTATSNSIGLTKGATPVLTSIVTSGSTVTITPSAALSFSTSYTLQLSSTLKSALGVALASANSVSFTTAEPGKVYILNVVAMPTDQESITLKNNSGTTQDISGWSLGDKNDPTAYRIPNGTVLTQGQTKIFVRTTLGFQINDSGEVIYLRDATGAEIDTWSN